MNDSFGQQPLFDAEDQMGKLGRHGIEQEAGPSHERHIATGTHEPSAPAHLQNQGRGTAQTDFTQSGTDTDAEAKTGVGSGVDKGQGTGKYGHQSDYTSNTQHQTTTPIPFPSEQGNGIETGGIDNHTQNQQSDHAHPHAIHRNVPPVPTFTQGPVVSSGATEHMHSGNHQIETMQHGQGNGYPREVSSTERDQMHGHSAQAGSGVERHGEITEEALGNTDRLRIAKSEEKHGKRVSKVLKDQGRAEDAILKTKIKELGRLQKACRQAGKDEASATALHSKAVKAEHKLDMDFLAARAKHEKALSDLKAKEAAVSATKQHVKEQANLLGRKEAEIEELRERKAIDDRERAAKLQSLSSKPTKGTAAT